MCEQINIIEPDALALPHIHALHPLVLSESTTITAKKIQGTQNLMPEELREWNPALGWHEGENICYNVVREPKLYRTYVDEMDLQT